MKLVACLSFLLNTVFFATYYSVSKEALGRIDPIVFSFFEMMTLAPIALCIVVLSWREITREVLKRGMFLGSCLCLALFTISIALKYTTATSTAFFPSLNGFLASLIAWIFLRQPISKATWFAGLLSTIGTVLLIMNSSMDDSDARGSLIAFLGGLFFTCYVFLADHEHKDETAQWALFGIELLTMAAWANLLALLFGDWQSVHPALPKDVWVILYVAGACTFLPTLVAMLMQKYISPVTVSFIYILEPILGAIVAEWYLHETLPLDGYIGGGLVVAGAIIHTWGAAEGPPGELSIRQRLALAGQRLHSSLLATLVYPALFFCAGAYVLYQLGGFLPPSWRELYRLGPLLPVFVLQGQGMFVFMLVAQSACWLLAWFSLITMGCLATHRALRKLFFTPTTLLQDTQPLEWVDIAQYSGASVRSEENTLPVQRHRKDRRQRLARIELVELVEHGR